MNLPKRSTEKPQCKGTWKDNGPCIDHPNQQFNPSTPNSVWADVDLTMKTFEKAYSDRGEPNFVLFHSDQGSEYINRYNTKRPHSSLGDLHTG